jgi:hypothetical protein
MNDICQTDFGKFRIKIERNNIKVGGRNFCVNLALYEKGTSLYWLKTDEGGCELNEKDISGINTILMTDLAFSLLRKHNPERNSVTLLDDSGFSWKVNDRLYKTNFLKGYLLFYGKTWYEDKFNAVMCNSDIFAVYREKADNNFNDPSKKPAEFDFMNDNHEVKEKLEPLYRDSSTWREFLNKIMKKYDKEKYMLIYTWYRSAIYIIFDGMEINQDWKIDISNRQIIDCKQVPQKGGRTRKASSFSKYKRLEPFHWSPL